MKTGKKEAVSDLQCFPCVSSKLWRREDAVSHEESNEKENDALDEIV